MATAMYKKLGYVIYRRILGYYSGTPDEDAFGNYLKVDVKTIGGGVFLEITFDTGSADP